MKKSEIKITVELDEQKIPQLITWNADDKSDKEPDVVEAINLSFWNASTRETMKLDLWTKSMPVHEMKMFYVDMIGSLSDSIMNATGDEKMALELKQTAEKLMQIVESEFK